MTPEIPADAEHYFTTKTFDALTTPLALLHEHRTADDIWGEVVVECSADARFRLELYRTSRRNAHAF